MGDDPIGMPRPAAHDDPLDPLRAHERERAVHAADEGGGGEPVRAHRVGGHDRRAERGRGRKAGPRVEHVAVRAAGHCDVAVVVARRGDGRPADEEGQEHGGGAQRMAEPDPPEAVDRPGAEDPEVAARVDDRPADAARPECFDRDVHGVALADPAQIDAGARVPEAGPPAVVEHEAAKVDEPAGPVELGASRESPAPGRSGPEPAERQHRDVERAPGPRAEVARLAEDAVGVLAHRDRSRPRLPGEAAHLAVRAEDAHQPVDRVDPGEPGAERVPRRRGVGVRRLALDERAEHQAAEDRRRRRPALGCRRGRPQGQQHAARAGRELSDEASSIAFVRHQSLPCP